MRFEDKFRKEQGAGRSDSGADEFTASFRRKAGSRHGAGDEPRGAGYAVAAGQGACRGGGGIRQPHLHPDDLHGAETAGQHEHNGWQRGGELGGDAAPIRSATRY